MSVNLELRQLKQKKNYTEKLIKHFFFQVMRCLKTLVVFSVTLVCSLSLETTSTRYLEGLSNDLVIQLVSLNGSLKVVNTPAILSNTSLLLESSLGTESKEGSLELRQARKRVKGKIKTTTPKTKLKYALSTLTPISIQLTKPTTKKPPRTSSRTTKKPTKLKTTSVKKKSTTKSTTPKADLKQNWYEDGVPYPNPMPEITSSSPPFSLSETSSQIFSSSTEEALIEGINPEIYSNSPSEPLQGVPPILPLNDDLESVSVDSSSLNPISTFNLDMLPAADLTRDPAGNPCPTVHISSAVLSPLQSRQGCSDLNLVLNTHYHQNQDTRNPAVSTYDATSPDVVETVAEDAVVDDGLANAGPVAADPVSNAGTAASGGSGGSGGAGGDGGGNGGFKLPDLKPMFEALGYVMQGLGWLMQRLMNPWLYIIPVVLFFKVGFLGILTLFPWWIPLVFLYFSVKTEEPKHTVEHVKHHHRPVVVKHPNGWFWDHHTKTWRDVVHPHRHRSDDDIGADDQVDDKISGFGQKLFNQEHEGKFWGRKR